MIALIIVLIFSMAFIGFHINGFSSNFITNKPENNKHFEKMVNVNTNENVKSNSDENYTEMNYENETRSKIYNEMGDLLNPVAEKIENVEVIDITTFKGEGLPSAKPFMNVSLKITDDNGLTVDYGSYKDNFPYESAYLKKINSENKVDSVKNVPIIKNKIRSNVSKVILPSGIKEYVEDFDYFKKSVSITKDTIATSNKILLAPKERIIHPADKITNFIPDEIVFKTKPDTEEFSKLRNELLLSNVDKREIFYTTSKKIDESKNIFNIK